MLKKTYRIIMDDTKNPLKNLPPVVRFQFMTVLAYMWSAIFSLGIGSYAVFGTTVILHTLALGGIFITAYYFHNAQIRAKINNEDNTPKTLIIDDDEITAKTYSKFLEQYNIKAHVLTDASKALEKIDTHKPDLIFMDIKMPYASGYEVAKVIHQAYGKENSPEIVYMTGALKKEKQDYDHEDLEEGGVLLKPLRPLQMANIVDQQIQKQLATA